MHNIYNIHNTRHIIIIISIIISIIIRKIKGIII